MLTIGDKVVETLYSNRVTSENKRICAPNPVPLHSKLGCLLFSIGSSNIGTTLHGEDGGRKAIFPPFEVSKTSKSPVLGKVSQLILSPIAGTKNPLHALEIGPAKDQSPNTELFEGSFFNGTLFSLIYVTNYLDLRIFSFSLN